MDRKGIYDLINALYPTHFISQERGECISPYVVIKYKPQVLSLGNNKAGWQYIDLMVYVPLESILPLDEMIEVLRSNIGDILEFTGNITPDFIDVDVKAIMRSMEYRIPKVIK